MIKNNPETKTMTDLALLSYHQKTGSPLAAAEIDRRKKTAKLSKFKLV